MKVVLKLIGLGFALRAIVGCSALGVPADETSVTAPKGEYDLEVLEQYRPSDDERTLYPDRLWYFDHPDLFPNEAYLLTNDLGASSAYLVEASNTTHWELQGHSLDPSSKFSNLEKRQTVHYINSYHEGGCIPNTFVGQAQNPPNGFCQRWYVWRVKSLFVVGDGNFQVNFYWGDAQSCSRNFLGGVRAYSGCWTTPNSDQLPWEFWPCYTC